MARTPKKSDVIDLTDASIDKGKVSSAMALMRTDAAANELALTEQNERVAALAHNIGYTGSLHREALVDGARNSRERLGQAIFSYGAYLLLLRAGSEHGSFMSTLAELGIEAREAQKYMQITRRMGNASTSAHFEKLGYSKITELLPLDDEQIDELVDSGTTGELALDDVARMSVKELRAAVRKERAESSKHKNRAERQEAVNAELHEEVRLIKRLPQDEELVRVQKEAVEIQAELQGMLQGRLRQALIALNNSEPDQSLFMGGMVGQLMSDLVMLRDEFSLPEMGGKPEWQRFAEAQELGASSKAKAN
jgi:hypothetical protein